MIIFTWIVLGIAGLLLLASAACWGVFIAADSSDWRRLGIKVFRIAMVFVLFYINGLIYGHLFGVVKVVPKAVAEAAEE